MACSTSVWCPHAFASSQERPVGQRLPRRAVSLGPQVPSRPSCCCRPVCCWCGRCVSARATCRKLRRSALLQKKGWLRQRCISAGLQCQRAFSRSARRVTSPACGLAALSRVKTRKTSFPKTAPRVLPFVASDAGSGGRRAARRTRGEATSIQTEKVPSQLADTMTSWGPTAKRTPLCGSDWE